jgi:hypothetical protein
MKQLAKSLGVDHAVIFTGMRHDIPDVLAGSDVAVQCSRSENLGGSVEALLMARPTVASAVGGLVDTVRDGETGLLVPMDDHGALADAILRLLDNPEWAARLGKNGRELMLREFTLAKTVDDIERLYVAEADKIAAGGRRSGERPASRFYRPLFSILHLADMGLRWTFFVAGRDGPRMAGSVLRRAASFVGRIRRSERTRMCGFCSWRRG